MINVNELKPGITFLYKNNIYVVIASQHSKSGRGQAHVKLKVKNIRNQAVTNITFAGSNKVSKAHIETIKMQFLFKDEEFAYFMNMNNYEQVNLAVDKIKEELFFIKENQEVKMTIFENEILGVVLPTNVYLKVIKVEEGTKGNSTSAPMKKAILETKLEIMVPLFIKEEEEISVSTLDKKYLGRK